jgi:hypothetical protein
MTLLMITNGVFNECALGFIAFGERVTAQQTFARGKEMCVFVLYVGNPCTLRLGETRE